MIKRLVINLTNHCNECCPFCCVEASPNLFHYITIKTLQSILDSYPTEPIEIQLTGGEPTLHKDFYELVTLAGKKQNAQRIIIDTNGTDMERVANQLSDIAETSYSTICMKISINYWLCQNHPDHLSRIKKLISAYQNQQNFEIILSVVYRVPEELDSQFMTYLEEKPFTTVRRIMHPISFIGRAKKLRLSTACLNEMKIQSAEPVGYATDGSCFGSNLEKRNQYELEYQQ